MKFNMKNHPIPNNYNFSVEGNERAQQYIQDTLAWAKGFEKELREMLRDTDNYWTEKFIREVLGENHEC